MTCHFEEQNADGADFSITQMSSVRAAEPICAICEISDICVGFGE